MSELKKLQEKHRVEIEKLQASCPHPERSDWVEEWWAIGHPTGRIVKYCLRCGKGLEWNGLIMSREVKP